MYRRGFFHELVVLKDLIIRLDEEDDDEEEEEEEETPREEDDEDKLIDLICNSSFFSNREMKIQNMLARDRQFFETGSLGEADMDLSE